MRYGQLDSTDPSSSPTHTTHSRSCGASSWRWMGRRTISEPPRDARVDSDMVQPSFSCSPRRAISKRRCARASAQRSLNERDVEESRSVDMGRKRAGFEGAEPLWPRRHLRISHPDAIPVPPLSVHLVDGTYELFRQFHGRRRFEKAGPAPFGAVAGVLHSILEMIEKGATHVGVATDHVIESFRNQLWPGYKTGEGIEPALWRQFHPLEQALGAMGVAVWPMVELEADDALASAARAAAADGNVAQVCIWTPDKDLAQCVRGDRVVQVLRRAKKILDAEGVRAKFGVDPERIPDLLALVGDAADGYPGIAGIGHIGAARLIGQYGALEDFPAHVLGKHRERALLFKDLATLRSDARLFANVEELRWRGPADAFPAMAARIGDARLEARCVAAALSSRRTRRQARR